MKHCKYCKQDKPFDSLAKYCSKESGFNGKRCWDCYLVHRAKQGRENYKYLHVKKKALDACKAWKAAHRGEANAINMRYYAAKLMRVMPWTEHDAIATLYKEASSKGLHVDHIIPIQGATVSGLHVRANLQLLTPSENSAKGNIF